MSNKNDSYRSDININQYRPKDAFELRSYNDFEFKELKLENKQLKNFIDEQSKNLTRLQADFKEKLYNFNDFSM